MGNIAAISCRGYEVGERKMHRENMFTVLRLKAVKLLLKILNYGIIVNFMGKYHFASQKHIL